MSDIIRHTVKHCQAGCRIQWNWVTVYRPGSVQLAALYSGKATLWSEQSWKESVVGRSARWQCVVKEQPSLWISTLVWWRHCSPRQRSPSLTCHIWVSGPQFSYRVFFKKKQTLRMVLMAYVYSVLKKCTIIVKSAEIYDLSYWS
jgi:hypothetical protein